MRRTPEAEAQLRSAAAAADRRNRPTMMVLVPAVLLLVAILYTAWSAQAFSSARGAYMSMGARTERVQSLIDQIKVAREQEETTTNEFRRAPYLVSDIGDDEADGKQGYAKQHGLSIKKIDPRRGSVLRDELLVENSVSVYMQGQSLDRIFRWMNACLEDENYKGRLFVKSINLKPNRLGGWDAEPVSFGIWETP